MFSILLMMISIVSQLPNRHVFRSNIDIEALNISIKRVNCVLTFNNDSHNQFQFYMENDSCKIDATGELVMTGLSTPKSGDMVHGIANVRIAQHVFKNRIFNGIYYPKKFPNYYLIDRDCINMTGDTTEWMRLTLDILDMRIQLIRKEYQSIVREDFKPIGKCLKSNNCKSEIIDTINTDAVKKVFKNKEILYYNRCSSQQSLAGPNCFNFLIIKDKDYIDFIRSKNIEIAPLISDQQCPVATADDAFLMVKAFADINLYHILTIDNTQPKYIDLDLSKSISTNPDGWTISIALVIIPGRQIDRFLFMITKNGVMYIISRKHILYNPILYQ